MKYDQKNRTAHSYNQLCADFCTYLATVETKDDVCCNVYDVICQSRHYTTSIRHDRYASNWKRYINLLSSYFFYIPESINWHWREVSYSLDMKMNDHVNVIYWSVAIG